MAKRRRGSLCGVAVAVVLAAGCAGSDDGPREANGDLELSGPVTGGKHGFPATTTSAIPSLVSSRSFALRAFSSGPWQAKQWSDRIGITSRLKSTGAGLPAGGEPGSAGNTRTRAAATARGSTNRKE